MKKKKQIDILRGLSGAKRLEIACELSEMVRELALANIKQQNPKASKEELIQLLRKRMRNKEEEKYIQIM